MNVDLSKRDNETERQYIWRIHQYVNSGDITWQELADAVNKNFRNSEEEYRVESSYRKPVQAAETYYVDVFSKMSNTNEYSDQINEQKRELERKKIQFRDERNAWNRQNRIEARVDETLATLAEKFQEIGKIHFVSNDIPCKIDSDNDLLVMLTDTHIGKTFASTFGCYNTNIATERLDKYLEEILIIKERHNSKNCYVSLQGDLIEGRIHLDSIVSSQEDIIDQVKIAVSLICSFCTDLCSHFENVYLQSCSGNHSRVEPNKKEALHDERLDNLITWTVEQLLNGVPNFHVQHRNFDIGISDFSIRGKTYIACHGDYDSFSKQGVSNLCMMLGFFPYAILLGHKHYPAHFVENGINVIQSGSLCGSGDNYTVEHRMSNTANQTVLVCDKFGINAIYNINLN